MNDQLLIIFVKNARLGQVKSRLAKVIGDKSALFIYRQLVEHTLRVTKDLPYDRVVFYSREIEKNDHWEFDFIKQAQKGTDLGARMANAFEWAFAQGYKKVCLIGSDCYELTSDILTKAFNSLDQNQSVIGPALDGGYYLLGMKQLYNELFVNKSWSTERVLAQTLDDFEARGLTYYELPTLVDVDTEEDLPEDLKMLLR